MVQQEMSERTKSHTDACLIEAESPRLIRGIGREKAVVADEPGDDRGNSLRRDAPWGDRPSRAITPLPDKRRASLEVHELSQRALDRCG